MSELQASYQVEIGWTVTELSQEADVSGQYIRQLIAQGKIQAVKRGKGWIIPHSVAQEWLKSRNKASEA